MPFGEIGAFLLLLAAVFLLGNIWFHLAEALLDRIKKIFTHGRKPPAWHTLPSDEKGGKMNGDDRASDR